MTAVPSGLEGQGDKPASTLHSQHIAAWGCLHHCATQFLGVQPQEGPWGLQGCVLHPSAAVHRGGK